MCYGTRLVRKAEQLEFNFDVERILGELAPDTELTYHHANGWAHPNMWILPQERKGNMIPAKWGIMPSAANGAEYKDYFNKNRGAYGGLNLRSEDLFDHYMYSENIFSKRCIIPVDGFYEPHTTKATVKGKPFKVPFYFKKKDDSLINLAGVYNITQDKMATFSILTKKATPLFELVHNNPSNKYGDYRRPVALDDNEAEYWLEDGHDRGDIQDILDNDLSDYEFETWAISKDLNKADGNRANIIDRIEYSEVVIEY
ncbi:MAG: SOS response-associated peptidase [Flavobacteriaceae bacterium]